MRSDPVGQLELCALLAGREERARFQRFILSRSGAACVCQISLNIPGLPKKMDGEERALSLAERALTQIVGEKTATSAVLVNGAGAATLLTFSQISPRDLKKGAVQVEESADWCRILDIDVITREGSLSRGELGVSPRSCLICEKEAKLCARSGTHSIQDLREAFSRFLSRSFNSDASIR